MKNKFIKLTESIRSENIDVIGKLRLMVDFIRPEKACDIDQSIAKMDMLIDFFNNERDLATPISDEINLFFINLKLSINICTFGMLSRNGFSYELKERFYNKFLPNPPNKGELKYVFATIFNKKSDHQWTSKIDDEKWIELFGALFLNSKYISETKNHLFYELLYAVELLSIRIASEEFDDTFIRLDKTILNRDSAFIALQRDIAKFANKIQNDHSLDIDSINLDFKHLEVMISQCKNQVKTLKKKSIELGISIGSTYELELLTQSIKRIEETIEVIKKFESNEANLAFVKFFKESIEKNATRNSLSEVWRQSSKMLAKSITNNIGEHGEHYVVDNKKEYFKMFFSSAGAGIIIAVMALLKINIVQSGFPPIVQTILTCLDYGLGFVFIHLLGFTVATKQPAMTASTFAHEVEKEEDNRVNQNKLIELIFKVARSQFASVLGNITLALLVSFGISRWLIGVNDAVLSADEAKYYLSGLEPLAPLFFAAIAGVWLFCSGLIAGYFDNRADCLELRQRYLNHPFLKKILSDKPRSRLAEYLHDHHGAIFGNFIFGILLGITPFVGYLLNLPLDISHVAFSSAILGYSGTHLGISFFEFIYYLICVLMIGIVNLTVSFILALKVSLISRDTKVGNLFLFLKKLLRSIIDNPHHLVFPFKKEYEK